MIPSITLAFALATIYISWGAMRLRKGKPFPGYKYGVIISIVILVVGCVLVAMQR